MNNEALYTSNNQNWQTPQDLLNLVRMVGPIFLDPCTTDSNPTEALLFHTIKTNGLEQPWSKQGINYVNPPYNKVDKWVKKCVAERCRGCSILALIPARPDTKYWQDWVFNTSEAVCFIRGRVKFLEPTKEGAKAKHPAPMPNAMILWTPDPDMINSFNDVFSQKGRVFITNKF